MSVPKYSLVSQNIPYVLTLTVFSAVDCPSVAISSQDCVLRSQQAISIVSTDKQYIILDLFTHLLMNAI